MPMLHEPPDDQVFTAKVALHRVALLVRLHETTASCAALTALDGAVDPPTVQAREEHRVTVIRLTTRTRNRSHTRIFVSAPIVSQCAGSSSDAHERAGTRIVALDEATTTTSDSSRREQEVESRGARTASGAVVRDRAGSSC